MSKWLKQNTAATIRFGPFVATSDGNTQRTTIAGSLTTANIRLSKNGAAFGSKNSAVASAHDEKGWYSVNLDATDTNTLGSLEINTHLSSVSLAVWKSYLVVPSNVYNSLVAGSSQLGTRPVKIASTVVEAISTAIDTASIEKQGTIGTTITRQQAESLMLAVLVGVTSSGGDVFKTPDGNSTRVHATIDGSNNRTAQVITPSS